MATNIKDKLMSATVVNTVDETEPRVRVIIPMSDEDDGTVKTDHYEHVTINGEPFAVIRGQYVDVPVSVFLQLRNKYPTI